MICVLAFLMLIQEDGLSPKKSAVLQIPNLEQASTAQDQSGRTGKITLNQDSLDEIKAIRKRIGIQIFKDKKSDSEFNQQLNRIQTAENLTNRTWPVGATPKREPVVQAPTTLAPTTLAPTVERPRIAGFPTKPVADGSQAAKTLESLFSAIEQLDRSALQLEKQGQFEKSKKMRKLSRKIQKQTRSLLSMRDY